eukprot:10664558-Lingulodinium_polyedra.AAC.1
MLESTLISKSGHTAGLTQGFTARSALGVSVDDGGLHLSLSLGSARDSAWLGVWLCVGRSVGL